MAGALDGIRVLDLTWGTAALGVLLLAEGGGDAGGGGGAKTSP
jgi:hypothetical protein